MSCQQTWAERWIYALWPLDSSSKGWSQSISHWHHDFSNNGRDLFAILVLIYFQTQLHQMESCGFLHLAWVFSLCWSPLLAKSRTERLEGRILSVYVHIKQYAKNAKNAIYVQYVLEITLVTALVTAVGAVTMQILCQSSVQILCQSSVELQYSWHSLFTSRSFALSQCETSLGVPITCLACWRKVTIMLPSVPALSESCVLVTQRKPAGTALVVLVHMKHLLSIGYRYSKSDLEAWRYGDLHRDNLDHTQLALMNFQKKAGTLLRG